MSEIWLQANRRPYVAPLAGVAATAVGCGVAAIVSSHPFGWSIAAGVAAFVTLALWLASRRPRLAFDGRRLLLQVRAGSPVAVPIELVEGFLLGKGPSYLTGRDDYVTETSTLVVRIAERAEEFAKVETNVRLAAWCGHYCTLRGTWTEPLSVDVVNRLNQRLYEAQQAIATPERVAS
jgi:hypothetical protein